MAVPKRKMSRANTRTRRSAWKADLTELNTVKVAGREVRIPRRLAKAYKNGLLDVEALSSILQLRPGAYAPGLFRTRFLESD